RVHGRRGRAAARRGGARGVLAELRRARTLAARAGEPHRARPGGDPPRRGSVVPGRAPAALQREVRPALAAALPALRARVAPAPGGPRRDGRRRPAAYAVASDVGSSARSFAVTVVTGRPRPFSFDGRSSFNQRETRVG